MKEIIDTQNEDNITINPSLRGAILNSSIEKYSVGQINEMRAVRLEILATKINKPT